jgi:hypothetical protein
LKLFQTRSRRLRIHAGIHCHPFQRFALFVAALACAPSIEHAATMDFSQPLRLR